MMIERCGEPTGSGGGAGIANPEGGKPKRMHWCSFDRLKAEHDVFANASWAGMANLFRK